MTAAAHDGNAKPASSKPASEFELLAVNPIDEYVMATPAISNGSLFVRSSIF